MQCRFIYLILFPVLLLTGCTSFQLSNKDYVFQEVYYLTTREDTHSENPDKRYNGKRGEPSVGIAMVAIDPKKAFSSFAEEQPNRELQQTEMLRTRALQQIQVLSVEEFRESISLFIADNETAPEALIYIHGYKKDFDDNVTNAAKLRFELAFPGPVFAFSWPSTNRISGYLTDIENLEWSESQLRRLLAIVAEQIPGVRIHLLAHSMGNRGLVESLFHLYYTEPDFADWSIGEIIFAAPDFDRAIFIESVAKQLEEIPFRKTLYVSSHDFPLLASAQLYQYPRLGDSRHGAPVIEGIQTIDVSDAINITDGHGYYESNQETIDDLYYLIREGNSPAERPTLIEVKSDNGSYWRLKRQE